MRWGEDEPNAENVPRDLRFSSVMPGGFDSLDVTLPRKPGVDYEDLGRLSTIRTIGAGGEAAGEYRLERAPRTSGNEMSVSPGCVGWQAHLEDDKSASMVYVDIDLGNWIGTSAAFLDALGSGWADAGFEVSPDSGGAPTLRSTVQGVLPSSVGVRWTAWYDAGAGNRVSRVYVGDQRMVNLLANSLDANNHGIVLVADTDTEAGAVASGDMTASSIWSFSPSTSKRFAELDCWRDAVGGGATGVDYGFSFAKVGIYGDHGLPLRGAEPAGLYASDVIAHAVGRWAPLLNYTIGPYGSIQPTSFAIPQLEFRERTTVAEIVKAANRFHLYDWAVWENKTLHFRQRRDAGRQWRARIAPAQLSETGPAVDRTWNGVLVRYSDVDGSSKTVGPPGSNANVSDAQLIDTDPENPANQAGIKRWNILDMGIVSTPAGATQVGARFLAEAKQLDSSGQAQLVGVVEDDKGIERPAWAVRAGDYISFVDASDSSPRRIIKADYSHSSRTCSVDLDAPPEALSELLDRLGVVLEGVL